jgi:hypothetical protein
MKANIYLDTTVVSALFDERTPERIAQTKQFWKHINDYNVFISELVIDEIKGASQPLQDKMSHGSWCNSKTIPMNCKYCGQKIYYFFCDCGCKVFFDELGGDWPIHDCIGYNKLNAKKVITTELIKKDKKVSWTFVTADEIDKKYKERIKENHKYLYDSKVPILYIESKNNKTVTVIGKITEIVNSVDIGKTFNIKNNNSIGANLLKEFQKGSYQQITIHTINLEERNKDSYTALILDCIMKAEKIMKGNNVIVKLIGKKILDINKWYCSDIRKIDETI